MATLKFLLGLALIGVSWGFTKLASGESHAIMELWYGGMSCFSLVGAGACFVWGIVNVD